MSQLRWYIMIHQIPARPLYLRAKIRKRLAGLGAVALKDSVYLLPRREDLLRNLREVAQEARLGGADTHILLADFVDTEGEVAAQELFRREREADYGVVGRAVRAWTEELKQRSGPVPPEGVLRARLARAKKRLSALEKIDFFPSSTSAEARAALAALEARLRPEQAPSRDAYNRELINRTWVTRKGIQVDRIASAWLVRRFIDPSARFRFIDPNEGELNPAELSFDMAGANFTHEEDRCTFETLIRRTGLKDPALTGVAEIVHDIDIKDGKFGRPESCGVEQLLLGVCASSPGDEERLRRGFALLDDLYQSFGRSSSTAATRGGRRGADNGGPA